MQLKHLDEPWLENVNWELCEYSYWWQLAEGGEKKAIGRVGKGGAREENQERAESQKLRE